MDKKNFLQIFLLLSVVSIILSVYFFYYKEDKNIQLEKGNNIVKQTENKIITNNDSKKSVGKKTNVIENLKFSSFDKSGNKYLIEALYGSADLVDDIVYYDMTNVVAVIKFPNGEKIEIKSNYARYNSLTYETNFKENIIARYINHTLTSENLDLLFLDNLITVYNKLIYKNLNDTLIADKLEIDIITKNLKIFMNNEYESVKIIRN